MFYELGLSPKVFTNENNHHDLHNFFFPYLGTLSPSCLIANLKYGKWMEEIRNFLLNNPGANLEIKELMKQFDIIPGNYFSNRPDDGVVRDWPKEIQHQHSKCPFEFRIYDDNDLLSDKDLNNNQFNSFKAFYNAYFKGTIAISTNKIFIRNTDEFIRIANKLIIFSNKIKIIDTYILSRDGFLDPLKRILDHSINRPFMKENQLTDIEIHFPDKNAKSKAEVSREFGNYIADFRKRGTFLKFICWTERDDKILFHDRYFWTNKGALNLGKGHDLDTHIFEKGYIGVIKDYETYKEINDTFDIKNGKSNFNGYWELPAPLPQITKPKAKPGKRNIY